MEMTVKALLDRLTEINKEIGCDGKRTGSHTYPSSVQFFLDNEDIMEFDLTLEDIDVETTMGCGCWTGVIFRLRAKKI